MSNGNYSNLLVTCPYDEAHRLKASRLQQHIAKCKLNHLDAPKERCPFNATHLLDKHELNFHLINCPDRGCLDRLVSQDIDKNNPYKGNTSVPSFSDPIVEPDEEAWDSVVVEPQQPAYRPPPPGALIEPPAMSKPSERKSLYRQLHTMHGEEQNKDPIVLRQPVPRQPNPVEVTKPKAEPIDVKTIPNVGLGRGKNRIAASLNNNLSNGTYEKSYSNIVKNMSNLGLGRGQPANPVPSPKVYEDDDDDEFPVLGCGRGAFTTPRQNPRTPGTRRPN